MPAVFPTFARGVAGARRRGLRLAVLLSVLALSGCALEYVSVMQQVDRDLASQQPQAALKALQDLSGGRDQVLYLLNKAMVQRMAGQYADSVQSFEQAKPLMQYLEATSVTETAAALTVTEQLRTYQAPLYERLLVHVYQGLNFLQLGQPDSARVEALQIDDLLKRLYPATAASPNGGDAFPRYFSGLVFESLGEYSDAMIAYRQALKAYKAQGMPDGGVPQDLKLSLCRFADFLGLKDELAGYKQRFGIDSWPPVDKNDSQGQIIFIFSNGLGPVKIAQSALLPDPVNGHYYSVSLPVLRRRPPRVGEAVVSAGGGQARTEQVENIAADASLQLAADRPKLLAAEFARNIARAAAANQADKNAQGLGSLLSLVASVADQADVRIWGTLPDDIQLARLRLAPGTYDLTVDLAGRMQVLKGVTVQAGQITFTSMQFATFN